jgi:hypothetical protein
MKKKTTPTANELAQTLVSTLIPRKTIDQSAQTITEIVAVSGVNKNTVGPEVRRLLAEGKIEKVWKRVNSQVVPAYRVVKK